MANIFQGFTLLENFSIIFIFIFIWALVYGFLKSKIVKGFLDLTDAIIALLSFAIALIFVLVRPIVEMFAMLIPIFVIGLIIILLILLLIMSLGIEQKDITRWVKTSEYIQYIIVIVSIVVVLLVGAKVFGPALLPYTTPSSSNTNLTLEPVGGTTVGSFEQNLINILFNPKILGLIFLAIMFFLLINLLGKIPGGKSIPGGK